jgi:NAD(P)H-hydrate epimerase
VLNLPNTSQDIPYLTTDQMVAVDRIMIQEFKIELIQMMENAGRNLAHLARTLFLKGNPNQKKIIVMAGSGGNGGGALVSARWLQNWGAQVKVYLSRPDQEFAPVPAHQLDILRRMRIPIASGQEIIHDEYSDLIVDGLIGYSLKGAPRGTTASLIRWANQQSAPVLALDNPSGVDAATGMVFDPAIRAAATMTLALPKEGLRAATARPVVGELYLADIGVPPRLYEIAVPGISVGALFAESEIIRLW